MNFMTVLINILAVVETAALIGAMVFGTRAIKQKKDSPERKSLLKQAAFYFGVYITLNMVRMFFFQ